MPYIEAHLTTKRSKRQGHFYNETRNRHTGRFVKGTNSRWSQKNNLKVATKNILEKEKIKFIMVINLSYSRHNKIVSEIQVTAITSLKGEEFYLVKSKIENVFYEDNVLKEFSDTVINEAIRSTGRSGIPWDEINVNFKSFEYLNYSSEENSINSKALVRGRILLNSDLSIVEARIKEVLEDVL